MRARHRTKAIAGNVEGDQRRLAELAYGRDNELEADTYGARYASAAGYDPREAAHLPERLSGDLDAVLTHLGIAREDDTDAVAYGLTGDDLATAQREVLAGYERRMAQG